jgi:hypothetical protein
MAKTGVRDPLRYFERQDVGELCDQKEEKEAATGSRATALPESIRVWLQRVRAEARDE